MAEPGNGADEPGVTVRPGAAVGGMAVEDAMVGDAVAADATVGDGVVGKGVAGEGVVDRGPGVDSRLEGVLPAPGALVTSGLAGEVDVEDAGEVAIPDRPVALGRAAPPAATTRLAAASAAPPAGLMVSPALVIEPRPPSASRPAATEPDPGELGATSGVAAPLPLALFEPEPEPEPEPLLVETERSPTELLDVPEPELSARDGVEPSAPFEPVETLGAASVVIGVVPPPVAGRDEVLAPGP